MQDELRVYQRAGEPCFRCGRPVRRIVIGARSTHFCSWCQRLPAGEKAGAAAILRGMEPRPGQAPVVRTGPRWTEIGGADGSLGTPTGSTRPRRRARRRSRAPSGRSARRRRVARRPARRPGRARTCAGPPDVDPAARGRPPRGRHVRHPRLDQRGDRARRPRRPRRAERRRQDDAAPDRRRPRRAGRREGLAQARAVDRHARPGGPPRRAVHGRAGHSVGGPSRRGAPRGDGRRARGAWSTRTGSTEPAYEALQHRFEGLGGYTLDQRVDEALSGLGFTIADMARPPSSLSGGEQTRATLARLVIAAPDLLLLDEPTNHLDLGALEWLEDHLRRRARLAARRVARPGVPRRDREPDLGAAGPEADRLPRRLQLVPPPARGARRVRGEVRGHARAADRPRARARPDVPEPSKDGEDARARGAARAAPGREAGRAEVERGSCACRARGSSARGPVRSGEIVIRARGARGRLPARTARGAGAVPRGPARRPDRDRRARTGPARRRSCGRSRASCRRSTAPSRSGTASSSATSRSSARRRSRARRCSTRCSRSVPVTPGEARGYLARFLFRGDDVFKEVRLLSGGERSRLELALLGVMPSNVYLLDEPTNHLDVVAREAIEAFLLETPATMLVVSHDRRFLDTVCERLWVVDDGAVAPFDGGYRAWRAAVSDGWTVAAALEQEAKRLRPGAAGRRAHGIARGATAPAAAAARRDRAPPVHAHGPAHGAAGTSPPARAPRGPKLSKDAYRRQREAIDARADAPRPAQEPPRARAVEAGRAGQLHRAAPGLERARRRRDRARRRRGRLARARGAGAVTGRASASAAHRRSHRPDRADRLRQVDGRRAGSASSARASSMPTGRARGRRRRAAPALAAVVAAFGPAVLRADGTPRPRRARPRSSSPTRRRSRDSRRSSIRRSGRGSSRRSPRPKRRGAPAVVDRGDQARRGWPRRAVRRGLARDLRPRRAARAAGGSRRGCRPTRQRESPRRPTSSAARWPPRPASSIRAARSRRDAPRGLAALWRERWRGRSELSSTSLQDVRPEVARAVVRGAARHAEPGAGERADEVAADVLAAAAGRAGHVERRPAHEVAVRVDDRRGHVAPAEVRVDIREQRRVIAVVVLPDVLAELERLVDLEVARDDVADLARVDVARPVVRPGEVQLARSARRRCRRRNRYRSGTCGVPSSSKALAEKMKARCAVGRVGEAGECLGLRRHLPDRHAHDAEHAVLVRLNRCSRSPERRWTCRSRQSTVVPSTPCSNSFAAATASPELSPGPCCH